MNNAKKHGAVERRLRYYTAVHAKPAAFDADPWLLNTPAFIWVGWRGSREKEIYELLLLAHDIAITTANADLAFSRLKIKATALNTVALTCQ
jgi:hypothetical protein